MMIWNRELKDPKVGNGGCKVRAIDQGRKLKDKARKNARRSKSKIERSRGSKVPGGKKNAQAN